MLALTFWPTLLASTFCLGLNEGTVYHIARARSTNRSCRGDSYASSALLLQLVVALGGTVVVLLLLPELLPSSREKYLGAVLCFAALFTPLMFLDLHFKAVLQGRGAVFALNLVRLVQPLAYSIALVLLALTGCFEVKTVMAAMIFSLAVSFLFGAFFGTSSPTAIRIDSARHILLTGWKFHLANLLLYAGAEADKFIVVLLMDDQNAGYYSVAIAISSLGSGFVIQSMLVLLIPEMSAANDQSTRRTVLARYVQDATILLFLVNGVAALTAASWVPFLYGDKFGPAVPVVMILLLMGTVKGLRQLIERGMRATQNTSIGMISEGLAIMGLILFASAGATMAGLIGLAWGLFGAQCIALAVIMIASARALDIDLMELFPFRTSILTRLSSAAAQELKAIWEWRRR